MTPTHRNVLLSVGAVIVVIALAAVMVWQLRPASVPSRVGGSATPSQSGTPAPSTPPPSAQPSATASEAEPAPAVPGPAQPDPTTSKTPSPTASRSAKPRATATSTPTTSPTAPAPAVTPLQAVGSWGPSEEHLAQARAAVSAMSPQEVAGQVIIAGWSGTNGDSAITALERYHVGGLIFMGPNIKTAEQVAAAAAKMQTANAEAGRTWPLVLSVDQEGGRVSRLKNVISKVPAFNKLAEGPDSSVRTTYAKMAREMSALGFTMDFAPVADVTIGAADPAIGDRSPAGDPHRAADAVVAATQGLLDGAIVPTVKHFPGHGSVTTDSHVGLPVQSATVAELWQRDLIPFQAAVNAGVPVVMIGHIDVPELDPGVPASLSPAAYALLRDELGFAGVTVTDALNMAAVTAGYKNGEESVAALRAGVDLLLMPPNLGAAHEAIVAALADGSLSRDRIDDAATRVVAMQLWQAESR